MDYYACVRAFTHVVESGSFVKAAAALDLPRNTVTKLVQSLEAHLRVRLLNRTTRQVSLTSDGAVYYERMARILDEWQEAESELAHAQANPRGRLRVDMASAVASLLVIPALPAFRARYPELQLDIGVSDRPADLVSERVDCVLRMGRIADPSLVARQVGDLHSVSCASPAYIDRHGAPAHPTDLEQGHEVIRYFYAGSGRKAPFVLERGHEQVTVQARHFIAVNDGNGLLAAAVAGLGIANTPRFIVQAAIEAGALVPVLEGWSSPPIPASVVYAPNRHLSARVRVFVDWLAELFAAQNRPGIITRR